MFHRLDSVVCRHPVTRLITDKHVTARVGVAFSLYSEAALAELGPAAADALEGFLAFAGVGALDTCWKSNGWGELAPQAIKAQLVELREKTGDYDHHEFFFGQGQPAGCVGTHAARLHAGTIGRGVEPAGDRTVSVLTFEFPLDVLDRPLAHLVGFFLEVAERVPYSAGNAGLSFRTNWTRANRAAAEFVDARLASYLGLHAGNDDSLRRFMLRRSPDAHWVNLLSTPLVSKLGGQQALATLPEGIEVQRLSSGVLLRSAEFPPIGEVSDGLSDLGHLPDVARFLKPIRVPGSRFPGVGRCDDVTGRSSGGWTTAEPTSVLPASSPVAASTPGRAKRWDAGVFFAGAKRLVESGDYYEAFFRLSAAGYAGNRQAARLAEQLVHDGHLDSELRTIACFELGVAYEKGAQVPRDARAAEVWLRNAARFGSQEAVARLERYAANAQTGNEPIQASE